ncbi:helix-hairpin-helix domain-containing protein, partial [Streptomyces niveiscabiei]|uniref:helix-hairpin-helix domain-containing protein n=1 Tax=Streptomyces niveiscabiei TaxID=164115 RepID=UPI0038F74640
MTNPDSRWFRSISTTRSVGINLNTASEGVLSLIPGMNDEAVKKLMDFRKTTPLMTTAQAQTLTGV